MNSSQETVVRRAEAALVDRTPPHSVDAEQGVLACMLNFPEMREEIIPLLAPADFYEPRHGIIYQACLDVLAAGFPPTPEILLEHLYGRRLLEQAGGAEYLNELLQRRSSGVGGPKLARVVASKSRQRQLIYACARIMDDAYDTPWDQTDQLLDEAEQSIFTVAEQGHAEQEPIASRDSADDLADETEDRLLTPELFRGFKTGWPSLDRILSGIPRGRLAVVAARPSVGKSAAALNMAASMASAGNRVLFCSLEMTRRECLARQVAATSGIPLGHILEPDGHMTEAELDRFYKLSGRLDTTIWYDDTAALSVGSLQAKARRMKAKQGLDVIFVDYLQLMTPPPGMPNRTEEERISSISRALKDIAKHLDIAIVALAQLNRQLEYRDDPRPRMADLRSSGAIEQDADTIVMLSRLVQPTGRDGLRGPRLADVPVRFDVVKNRQGQTGNTILLYRGLWTKFTDYDPFVWME